MCPFTERMVVLSAFQGIPEGQRLPCSLMPCLSPNCMYLAHHELESVLLSPLSVAIAKQSNRLSLHYVFHIVHVYHVRH